MKELRESYAKTITMWEQKLSEHDTLIANCRELLEKSKENQACQELRERLKELKKQLVIKQEEINKESSNAFEIYKQILN